MLALEHGAEQAGLGAEVERDEERHRQLQVPEALGQGPRPADHAQQPAASAREGSQSSRQQEWESKVGKASTGVFPGRGD